MKKMRTVTIYENAEELVGAYINSRLKDVMIRLTDKLRDQVTLHSEANDRQVENCSGTQFFKALSRAVCGGITKITHDSMIEPPSGLDGSGPIVGPQIRNIEDTSTGIDLPEGIR